jgi:hypothetical protein
MKEKKMTSGTSKRSETFALFFTFAIYVLLWFMFTLLFIVNHYMFQPSWPSSGVHFVVLKETTVQLFYCNCLDPFCICIMQQDTNIN